MHHTVLRLPALLPLRLLRFPCSEEQQNAGVSLIFTQRMQTPETTMPTDLKVLSNHIYEFKKGVRRMVPYTFNQKYESFATRKLESQNIQYLIQPVGNGQLNLFFGKPECLDAIRLIVNKPLCQLSPEEDFILGAMLGYDICAQCQRYCQRKNKAC